MIAGLILFTHFHTEYGTPLGPGAEEGELLERVSLISTQARWEAEGFFARRPLLGRGSLVGKKWFKSTLLTATGSETSWGEGTLGVFLGVTSFFGPRDVVWGGFCKEIAPVGGFCPFDGFKVAELGRSCCGVGVGGPEPLSLAGSFCEFLSEGG